MERLDKKIAGIASEGSGICPERHLSVSYRSKRARLIEGDIELNGNKLSAGDGASLEGQREMPFTSAMGAHFVLFHLN